MPMLKLSKILLPVDFSEQGAGAAPYASALARHFHAELTLMYVNEIYAAALVSRREFHGPIDTGWITALEAERFRELKSYRAAEFHDVEVHRIVVSGSASQQITERAHKEKTDLIVMPTHGYGPFRRFLLGSVTAKVLHDVECPVWTGVHMRETSQKGWEGARNVLCAIDGGAASERVLTWARDFAGEFGAVLTVVHAIPAHGSDDARATRANQAGEQIQCLKKKLGVPGMFHIGEGDPIEVVAEVTAQTKADVLVIGRSGQKRGLGRLRANAYALIRDSKCPVVSV